MELPDQSNPTKFPTGSVVGIILMIFLCAGKATASLTVGFLRIPFMSGVTPAENPTLFFSGVSILYLLALLGSIALYSEIYEWKRNV